MYVDLLYVLVSLDLRFPFYVFAVIKQKSTVADRNQKYKL